MTQQSLQSALDFCTYPPLGQEDWQYTFASARARVLEAAMFTRGALLDMANSPDFGQAVDMLGASDYALPTGGKTFTELENILSLKRAECRKLFADMMIKAKIVEIFRSRDDFANIRLALRRTLTEKPIDADYSNDGNVAAEHFEEIFEQENYSLLPNHMREAVERAVLAFYQNKDIRQIDFAVDAVQAQYNLETAAQLKSIFLLGLFRTQIDLTNIRTMLRLKLAESDQVDAFLPGGYIEPGRFKHGLDIGYEAIGPMFFATPYYEVVEPGATYFMANKSFLKLEQRCEEHLTGFLKSTMQITAGPQPVIAYLLLKENEIRTIRLIMTAKKNGLDAKLILDRVGE